MGSALTIEEWDEELKVSAPIGALANGTMGHAFDRMTTITKAFRIPQSLFFLSYWRWPSAMEKAERT